MGEVIQLRPPPRQRCRCGWSIPDDIGVSTEVSVKSKDGRECASVFGKGITVKNVVVRMKCPDCRATITMSWDETE